jgi:soluble lytic murein transglycosylase-like protein
MKLIAAVCLLSLAQTGTATDKCPDAAHRRAFKAIMSQSQRFGRYDGLILEHAQKHHLNPRLVKSIIAAESRFYDGAVSPTGARGLMQVMPATAEELGVPGSRLQEPAANLRAGTAYLDVLCGRARAIYALKSAGCGGAPLWIQERIVAAYHAGPRMFHREPARWPLQTRLYVKEVFLYYRSPATNLVRPPRRISPPAQRLVARAD